MAANNKPTQKPSWIPDNTTNITDPGSKATAGWTDEAAPSSGFNWFWNRVSQWIDFVDEQDYFVADYTITATSDPQLGSAISEIATLPRDLNGHTLKLYLTATSYVLASTLVFENFRNGSVIVEAATTATLTMSTGSGICLVADNCDNFTTLYTTFVGDNSSFSNLITNCRKVIPSSSGFSNLDASVGNSAVNVVDVDLFKSEGTLTLNSGNALGFGLNSKSSRVVIPDTLSLIQGLVLASEGGTVSITDVINSAAVTAVEGGTVTAKFNYLTLENYQVSGAFTNPSGTLYVANSSAALQATIKVVNIIGNRLYYRSTDTFDGDWNRIYEEIGLSTYLSDINASSYGTKYTQVNESV